MAAESKELLDLIKDGWFEEIQQMWTGKYAFCGGILTQMTTRGTYIYTYS
jgi:hypothetical protein